MIMIYEHIDGVEVTAQFALEGDLRYCYGWRLF